jgi:Domain of unknown function (DUF929)
MGKATRVRNESARQRIAAQQAAARRAETRRRMFTAAGSVVVVLAVVIGIIVVKLVQTPPKAGPTSTSASLQRQLVTIPAATFDAVGKGTAAGLTPITGAAALVSKGKPEVLYMGGEYCPYCGAERWAIAAAVSRFGTLSGVEFIHSSPTDSYPNTPTLTFYKAHYSSPYLTFDPVEWYGEQSDPNTPFLHVYLQHPTASEVALFNKYSGEAIPFLDVGNRFRLPGVQYQPPTLGGMSWAQVLAAMHNPASSVGREIDGAANIISAAICSMTGGQPGSVCNSAGVTAARGSI